MVKNHGTNYFLFVFLVVLLNIGAVPAAMAVQNQQRVVPVVITDESTGETLPGVNVIIQGTTIGSISNMEGEYSLEVLGPESVLVPQIGLIYGEGNYIYLPITYRRQPKSSGKVSEAFI